VKFLIEEKKLSERRAARLVQVSRTVLRYGKRGDGSGKLRDEIRRLSFRHRTGVLSVVRDGDDKVKAFVKK
jgi:hypothetical protein